MCNLINTHTRTLHTVYTPARTVGNILLQLVGTTNVVVQLVHDGS